MEYFEYFTTLFLHIEQVSLHILEYKTQNSSPFLIDVIKSEKLNFLKWHD